MDYGNWSTLYIYEHITQKIFIKTLKNVNHSICQVMSVDLAYFLQLLSNFPLSAKGPVG